MGYAKTVEEINNPKAIAFHKENLLAFKKAYWAKLSKAFDTVDKEKEAELKQDAENIRIKYNKRLREYCA